MSCGTRRNDEKVRAPLSKNYQPSNFQHPSTKGLLPVGFFFSELGTRVSRLALASRLLGDTWSG
jgi:hypothetical protein